MKITTSDTIIGEEIVQSLGLVRGNTIRARNVGRDIVAGLRNIVGGEIKEYTQMLTEARDEAIERMTAEAKNLEADAIVEVRFSTSQTMGGAAEILAYGTAVKLKRQQKTKAQ